MKKEKTASLTGQWSFMKEHLETEGQLGCDLREDVTHESS
jgi:hypothetical protein